MTDKAPERYAEGQRDAGECRSCGQPIWYVYHGPSSNHTIEPRLPAEAVEPEAAREPGDPDGYKKARGILRDHPAEAVEPYREALEEIARLEVSSSHRRAHIQAVEIANAALAEPEQKEGT